jgi:predicted esterase
MILRTWLLFGLSGLLFGCSSKPVEAQKFSKSSGESCFGSDSPKTQMIFFHGMDSHPPSEQFVKQMSILKEIAQSHELKVYVPRAPEKCPGFSEMYCWGWDFKDEETQNAVATALKDSARCLNPQVPVILVGFSNGANLLAKWFTLSEKSSEGFAINSIALFGTGIDVSVKEKKKVKYNIPLTFAVGTDDRFNLPRTQSLYKKFHTKYSKVRKTEFFGGHDLDKQTLIKSL